MLGAGVRDAGASVSRGTSIQTQRSIFKMMEPENTHQSTSYAGLTLLLGPRQAEVMCLFWNYGAATVREIHGRLSTEPALAYTTMMTICVRLTEKGLLTREQVGTGKRRAPGGDPYRYTPTVTEAAFTCSAVAARLQELQSHFPALLETPPARLGAPTTGRVEAERLLAELGGLGASDAALDQVAALLERAEAAERQAAVWKAEAATAQARQAAAERKLNRALIQLDHQQQSLAHARESATAVPFETPTGCCRVCGQAAPPAHRGRTDGLRVCTSAACRAEARRRDNNAKQRRYNERRMGGGE